MLKLLKLKQTGDADGTCYLDLPFIRLIFRPAHEDKCVGWYRP